MEPTGLIQFTSSFSSVTATAGGSVSLRHYFDTTIKPIGRLQRIFPSEPGDPDSLLDACIAFHPQHFSQCPSLAEAESALADQDDLDFSFKPQTIPAAWAKLRKEARPLFNQLHIWWADLNPLGGPTRTSEVVTQSGSHILYRGGPQSPPRSNTDG